MQKQLEVVSRRFGRENARQALRRTLRQLAPELQDTAIGLILDLRGLEKRFFSPRWPQNSRFCL